MNRLRAILERMVSRKPITFGEALADETRGETLVQGKQTWELAETEKNDPSTMVKCCEAEIAAFDATGLAPAPYYFERVAILARKQKDYLLEIEYCEKYINLIQRWKANPESKKQANIEKSPRYKAICKRLPKAKILYERSLGGT